MAWGSDVPHVIPEQRSDTLTPIISARLNNVKAYRPTVKDGVVPGSRGIHANICLNTAAVLAVFVLVSSL